MQSTATLMPNQGMRLGTVSFIVVLSTASPSPVAGEGDEKDNEGRGAYSACLRRSTSNNTRRLPLAVSNFCSIPSLLGSDCANDSSWARGIVSHKPVGSLSSCQPLLPTALADSTPGRT